MTNRADRNALRRARARMGGRGRARREAAAVALYGPTEISRMTPSRTSDSS
jgi:hypothetical protein